MITELPIPDFQIGLIQDERIIKMTDKRRKYKFNWLDRLYYMGVNYGPARWPMPFEALVYSVLMWPFVFILIASKNEQTLFYTLGIFIVILLFYERPLKKYWFTPERERAYFRRYPQRKHISFNTVWWLSLTITLTNFVLLGLVIILR